MNQARESNDYSIRDLRRYASQRETYRLNSKKNRKKGFSLSLSGSEKFMFRNLTHVHVIVRMNRLLTAQFPTHYFNGTVAYNLNEASI